MSARPLAKALDTVELSLFQISEYAKAAEQLTRELAELRDEDLAERDLKPTDVVSALRGLSVAIAAESDSSLEQIRLSREPKSSGGEVA